MKKFYLLITILGCAMATLAQDKSDAKAEKPQKPIPSAEKLEATFKAMLTKATMTGRWCSVKEGKLGPEKDDKYTIVSANKIGPDKWIISAQITIKQRDIVLPVPVQVKWAGDTAVLSVDSLEYPGGGTYSARVLFYEHTYAGTWSGGDYQGLMNGVITQEKEKE